MNISTYKKKSFGKIKLFRQIYTHHQKNPPPQKMRGHFPNVVKRTYKPLQALLVLNGERLSPEVRTVKRMSSIISALLCTLEV